MKVPSSAKSFTIVVAMAVLGACATSTGETQIPGAEPLITASTPAATELTEPAGTAVSGEAGAAGNLGAGTADAPTTTLVDVDSQATTAVPRSTAPSTTTPSTTVPPTTVAPTTAPATTVVATTAAPPPSTAAPAPPSTPAPPATAVPLALCVDGELSFFTEGRRGEVALYQQTLADLGYDPGDIDGFFGINTYNAASAEILDNGDVAGPEGVFTELFPDDGAVLPAAFERLGIGCSFEGDF